jgi:hypothetical protein
MFGSCVLISEEKHVQVLVQLPSPMFRCTRLTGLLDTRTVISGDGPSKVWRGPSP